MSSQDLWEIFYFRFTGFLINLDVRRGVIFSTTFLCIKKEVNNMLHLLSLSSIVQIITYEMSICTHIKNLLLLPISLIISFLWIQIALIDWQCVRKLFLNTNARSRYSGKNNCLSSSNLNTSIGFHT